ncbi:MAG: cysteine dioxygenase [Betaproteobacteria bacterium]|nr:MAG: cysteine dioxygenase [Betaproteobacteria bacterium]
MANVEHLRRFVRDMTQAVERFGRDEPAMLREGKQLLAGLIARDDWLPDAFAQPHPDTYRQYLLYCDPLERFSVVSFVWGPGHTTPVHDHTVWGLVGVLRGAEKCEEFERTGDGQAMRKTGEHLIEPGGIDAVSPTLGDIHIVSNALTDRPSISIHVYGANIGAVKRHVYVRETGEVKSFVSGYNNSVIPNLWDRSAQVRTA